MKDLNKQFTRSKFFPAGTHFEKGDKVIIEKLNGDTFINTIDRINAQSIVVDGITIQASKIYKIKGAIWEVIKEVKACKNKRY